MAAGAEKQLPMICIDFETFYDSKYTLSALDVVHYVKDFRFEVIGVSWQEQGQAAQWLSGSRDHIALRLAELRLSERTVVAHNAMFDGAILEWVFGIKPKKYLCSMMLARPHVVPFLGTASLKACSEFLHLPSKGDFASKKAMGKHRADFSTAELEEYGEYGMHDAYLSMATVEAFAPKTSQDELDLIDLTIKKFVRPKIKLDKRQLDAAAVEIAQREGLALLELSAAGYSGKDVTSDKQFTRALIKEGATPPMKLSRTTGKSALAGAKTDQALLELRGHENPKVRTLVNSRLLLKSSIDRTRIKRFQELADVSEFLPVPLLYFGAHTGRFSGMMGYNLQNLRRGSALRKAMRAAAGYKFLVADLAQIEARITAWLAGQEHLLASFRNGRDVYSEFASEIYGYPVYKCDELKVERFVGKTCILGLGFGMGAKKFMSVMIAAGIPMDLKQAQFVVNKYRNFYPKIPMLWKKLDRVVMDLATLPAHEATWRGFPDSNPVITVKREQIVLPNGCTLHYPRIGKDFAKDSYVYKSMFSGKSTIQYMWGGTLCENIVQALARIVLSQAEIKLARAGLRAVMQVHDELVFIVPEHTVEPVRKAVEAAMTAPITWMPGLPLACEVGVGDSYGEAK